MLRLTLVFGIVALFALPLRAQDASLEEAKAHAARAPLHYNIAQSYRQAGQYEKAKQFYKSYLREMDDPKNRTVIEKAIREIEELQAKERRAKDGPPKGIAQTPPVTGGATALAPPPTAAPQAGAPQTPERSAVAEALKPPASTQAA